MKQTTKIISLALVPISVACLAGGGIALSQIANDKNYWEDKAARSETDLATLESGLNTLKQNRAAYLDGQIAYDQGLKDYEQGKQDLAAGQAEYDAGLATLAEKQAEYDAGLAELQAAEQQLATGKRTLDANYQAYIEGKAKLTAAEPQLAAAKQQLDANYQAYIDGKAQIAQYEQGQADYQQGLADYQAGQAVVAANQSYLDSLAPAVEALRPQLEGMKSIVDRIIAAQATYEAWVADYNRLLPYQSKTASQKLPTANNLSEYVTAARAAGDETIAQIAENLENRRQTFNSTIQSIFLATNPYDDVKKEIINRIGDAAFNKALDNATLQFLINSTHDFRDYQLYQGADGMVPVTQASNAAIDIYNEYSAQIQAYDAGVNQLNAGKAQLATAEPTLAATKQTLDANYPAYVSGKAQIAEYEQGQAAYNAGLEEYNAGLAQIQEYEQGQAEYNAGLKEYNAGKIKLADGAVQLAAGRQQLTDAEQTIATGKQDLAAAETQLADGKAQLDEYETGQTQAISGLDTVLATETYGDLTSIADRLGRDFRYQTNGDLDPEQGLTAVQTAKAFSADNRTAVTHDLTVRTVVAITVIAAGVLALLTSFIIWSRASRASHALRASRT